MNCVQVARVSFTRVIHIGLLLFSVLCISGCLGIVGGGKGPVFPAVEPDPQKVEEVMAGIRTIANAAWWGFDPEDSTTFLQSAINSPATHVVVPNMGRDWVVRPINLRSDLTLTFEPGVVVTAKKGEYRGTNDSVLTGLNVENVFIRGYEATIRMHKEDYMSEPYQPGEWRMGLRISGGKNVHVFGLTIRDTGGDGIYISPGGRGYSEDVVIKDVVLDNNYRQGMSVISVKNLLIENSVFKNTSGTRPMAGIDFEPNHPHEKLEGIVVRNSVFENNEGKGIAIYPMRLNSDSRIDFVFEDILVRGNGHGVRIYVGSADNHPSGDIQIRNCLIEGSHLNGIHILHKDGDGLRVQFEDCIVHHARSATSSHDVMSSVPIYLGASKWLGAVSFNNVAVTDNKIRPVIWGDVRNPPTPEAFFSIEGLLEVASPYPARTRWDGPASAVSLEVIQTDSVRIEYDNVISLSEYQRPSVDFQVR